MDHNVLVLFVFLLSLLSWNVYVNFFAISENSIESEDLGMAYMRLARIRRKK
jgi:hypothetical protein